MDANKGFVAVAAAEAAAAAVAVHAPGAIWTREGPGFCWGLWPVRPATSQELVRFHLYPSELHELLSALLQSPPTSCYQSPLSLEVS